MIKTAYSFKRFRFIWSRHKHWIKAQKLLKSNKRWLKRIPKFGKICLFFAINSTETDQQMCDVLRPRQILIWLQVSDKHFTCATFVHVPQTSLERLIEQLTAIMLFIVMSITRLILYGYTLLRIHTLLFDPVHVWCA